MRWGTHTRIQLIEVAAAAQRTPSNLEGSPMDTPASRHDSDDESQRCRGGGALLLPLLCMRGILVLTGRALDRRRPGQFDRNTHKQTHRKEDPSDAGVRESAILQISRSRASQAFLASTHSGRARAEVRMQRRRRTGVRTLLAAVVVVSSLIGYTGAFLLRLPPPLPLRWVLMDAVDLGIGGGGRSLCVCGRPMPRRQHTGSDWPINNLTLHVNNRFDCTGISTPAASSCHHRGHDRCPPLPWQPQQPQEKEGRRMSSQQPQQQEQTPPQR